jgi:hypothetical protein
MPEQDDLRMDRRGALRDLPERQRTELGIQKINMVASVDERRVGPGNFTPSPSQNRT